MKKSIFITLFTIGLLYYQACDLGPCCNHDSPACPCFVSNTNPGAWDPSGTWIQDVANQTLGTRESCEPNGGQPYYQMVLGMNSPEHANIAACLLDRFDEAFDSTWDRSPWCSEAVSYWHREAEIPYETGYRNSKWHLDWNLIGSKSIRNFYQAEEETGGRGRWIDVAEMTPYDFRPGINAPVPGAYMRITYYNNSVDTFGSQNSHSLMVDSMTVYQDITGRVHRVRARFLEGNSGNRVTNSRIIDSLFAFTPGGTRFFSSTRKIYGFGIDLDQYGYPIYDPGRIDTVFVDPPLAPVTWRRVNIRRSHEEIYHASKLKELITYIKLISSGPKVTATVGNFVEKGIPDGHHINWIIPVNLVKQSPSPLAINFDLLDEHPIPIRGLTLDWSNAYVPTGYHVFWAGKDKKFREAKVPQITLDGLKSSPTMGIPVPVNFGNGMEKVRYIKIVFPQNAIRKDAVLSGIHFKYNWGPDDDAEEHPLPKKKKLKP